MGVNYLVKIGGYRKGECFKRGLIHFLFHLFLYEASIFAKYNHYQNAY